MSPWITRMATKRASSRPALHRLLAVVAGLVLAATAIGLASAHADYERSLPEADAVVREAPSRIDVWFTQEMFKREGANTLTLEDTDGATLAEGAVLDDADRAHLSLEVVADLEAGEYLVRWTTLSAVDGDEADGSFAFTIDPNAPEPTPDPGSETTAEPSATSEPPPSLIDEGEGGFPTWALIAALAIVASAALGGWAVFAGTEGERRE